MTLLYLIRHGETDWIGKRLPGWLPGVHINDRGRAQAAALARVLEGQRLHAIYTSPLERARQTARPLARARGLTPRRLAGLGEVRSGRWEGQSLGNLRRRKLWAVIQHAPSLARFPEGESFAEVQTRVVAALEGLRRAHPRGAVACFSHADVIKLAVAYYLGLPLDQFQRLSIAPASISVVQVSVSHARLLCLNDTRATEQAPAL